MDADLEPREMAVFVAQALRYKVKLEEPALPASQECRAATFWLRISAAIVTGYAIADGPLEWSGAAERPAEMTLGWVA